MWTLDNFLKVQYYINFVGIITSILCLLPHLHINKRFCKFSLKYTHYVYFSLIGKKTNACKHEGKRIKGLGLIEKCVLKNLMNQRCVELLKEREKFVWAKVGKNPYMKIFWPVLVFLPYLFTLMLDWLNSCDHRKRTWRSKTLWFTKTLEFAVFKAKTGLEVDSLLKNENWHFLYSFLESISFRVLNFIHIKRIHERPRFYCWKTLFFINF